MPKPASGAAIDGLNALTTSLLAAWGFLEGSGTTSADSVGARTLTLAAGGAWSTVSGDPVFGGAGVSGLSPASLATAVDVLTATPWSFFFKARYAATLQMAAGDVAGVGDYIGFLSTTTTIQNRHNGQTKAWTSTGDAVATARSYLFVCDGAGNLTLYQDGALVGSFASSDTRLKISTLLNGYNTPNFRFRGDFHCAYVWSGRALNSTDAASLHSNPYQIFVSGLTAGSLSITTPATGTTVGLTATVATGGTSPYTRQWYRSTTSGFTPGAGNIISGATALTLNDTGLSTGTTYYYKVVYTDAGSATATSAELPVTTTGGGLAAGTLSITTSATQTTVGLTATTATGGTPPYTRQWYRSTTSGFTPGGGNIVSGATALTLSDTGLTAATIYYYKVVYTDAAAATVTSAQLTVTTLAAAGGSIDVTTPIARQIHQRNGANAAAFAVGGSYTGAAPATIEVALGAGTYAVVTGATIGSGLWSGTAVITVTPFTAGVQGDFVARSKDSGGAVLANSGPIADVGVGDIFVGTGQSNAQGRLTNAQSATHATLKAGLYRKSSVVWLNLSDPTDPGTIGGSHWPRLATKIMAAQGVPVGFITGGVGGTALYNDTWMPAYGTRAVGSNLTAQKAVIVASKANGIKAILWYQGESDVTNATSRNDYAFALGLLAESLAVDYVTLGAPPLMAMQIGYNVPGIDAIRAGIFDADTASTKVLTGPTLWDTTNVVHPATDALSDIITDRFYAAMAAALYGASTGQSPRVVSASFNAARTEITVVFDTALKTGLPMTAAGWRVLGNGVTVTVSSVAYVASDPKAIKLILAAAAAEPVLVSLGLGPASSSGSPIPPKGQDFTVGSTVVNQPALAFLDFRATLAPAGAGGSYTPAVNVRLGTDRGDGVVGTLSLPLITQVLTGVQYGGGGNEYTGTYSAGGGGGSGPVPQVGVSPFIRGA